MTVLVIGSINLDMTFHLDDFVAPGETRLASAFEIGLGGKGANQAVAAARAGAKVAMAGAIGQDPAAQQLLEQMRNEGIDLQAVQSLPDLATGCATISLVHGENSIIVAPGANAGYDGALPPLLAEGSATILLQFEIDMAAAESALRTLPRARSIIINAAPAIVEGRSLFAHADVLVLNETELGVYAPPLSERDSIEHRASRLLEGRLSAVIVTLGAAGCLLVSLGNSRAFPAPSVEALDSVGAGDCFCGNLAAQIDAGATLDDAIELAIKAASIAVTRPGAACAMPTRNEVLAHFA